MNQLSKFAKKIAIAVLLVALGSQGADIFAGPTIIRDNRVQDTALTPVLGRGYSLSTNTYQSICMKNVKLTEPSYDMEYHFISSSDSGNRTRSTTNTASSDVKNTKSVNTDRWRNSSRRDFSYARSSSSTSTVVNGVTWYNYDMYVVIDLYSYYASVDESVSRLSDSALILLQKNDLPGFFNACGVYYIRSIGRKAKFVSKFTYRSQSKTRDEAFETQLRTAISTFSTESKNSRFLFWGKKETTTTSTTSTAEQGFATKFHENAEKNSLTIETNVFGLGKNEKASIISYDMDSFKAAIKDGFIAMQNPATGKVSHIEAVPWVENTEFQANVRLDVLPDSSKGTSEEKKDETTTTTTTSSTPGAEILDYEKKLTVNENAEFFIEVMRVNRNLWNMYYKANICQKEILTNWKNGTEWKDKNLEAALLLNNNDKQSTHKLSDLDQHLTKSIPMLFQSAQDFMAKEASPCIDKILKTGIHKKMHFFHNECTALKKNMVAVQDTLIEHYCLPNLFSVGGE